MERDIDFNNVPYLAEILQHLPHDPASDVDFSTYINEIRDSVAVNYSHSKFQFAYFGIHLIYMTYIHCTAWKISVMNESRYMDAVAFVRPYPGEELDLYNVQSVFDFSRIPERDIGKILNIIEIDHTEIKRIVKTEIGHRFKARIGQISSLVDSRNDLAHATGKIIVPNEAELKTRTNSIMTSINNIHQRMGVEVKRWYREVLPDFCLRYGDDFDIWENMVQDYNLSLKELLVCNEMSIRSLAESHPNLSIKLKEFKEGLKEVCINLGIVET